MTLKSNHHFGPIDGIGCMSHHREGVTAAKLWGYMLEDDWERTLDKPNDSLEVAIIDGGIDF